MHIIDLHCDTLYKAVTDNLQFDNSVLDVKPATPTDNLHRLQCYAIWIPDELDEIKSEKLFYRAHKKLLSEAARLGIYVINNNEKYINQIESYVNSAFFTIENGSVINNNIDNIKKFADMGVRIITLTWNGSNCIGDGAKIKKSSGLTDFGKEAVKEMEANGIIVDISHASDRLFYDVAEIANKPFIATHSNSRAVADNPRNLTDEQIKIIIDNGGLIGLNFHNDFLNNDSLKACKYDIIKHTEHFLSLNGEDCLCFGTDFDGCNLPVDIIGSESMSEIYEMFLRHNYKESVIDKIFYKNAHKFFENFDNQRIM